MRKSRYVILNSLDQVIELVDSMPHEIFNKDVLLKQLYFIKYAIYINRRSYYLIKVISDIIIYLASIMS